MSTTLTNGLKLPDKGSVDWYADMQNNYAILDGAVGTVAEHTSQIAGKAPAVHTHTKSDITDLLNSNFIPSADNSYDLGSSSYQWNNVYAKGYYYNGVAWGLNQQNEWTNFNTFNGYRFQIKHTTQEIGVIPASSQWNGFNFVDKNKRPTLAFEHAFLGSGETRFKVSMVDNFASNSAGSPVLIEFLRLSTYSGGSGFGVGANLNPLGVNLNLGTSTNKWKTLNGVNPGALSLPSATTEAIDVTNWVTNSWTANYCDAPFDGYISISCFANSLQINNETKAYGMTFQPGDDGFVCGLMPVCSGDHIKVAFVKTQTSIFEGYKFIKANGNV